MSNPTADHTARRVASEKLDSRPDAVALLLSPTDAANPLITPEVRQFWLVNECTVAAEMVDGGSGGHGRGHVASHPNVTRAQTPPAASEFIQNRPRTARLCSRKFPPRSPRRLTAKEQTT
jgi:hypothetical protein